MFLDLWWVLSQYTQLKILQVKRASDTCRGCGLSSSCAPDMLLFPVRIVTGQELWLPSQKTGFYYLWLGGERVQTPKVRILRNVYWKKYCMRKSAVGFITDPGNPPFFLVSILGICLVPVVSFLINLLVLWLQVLVHRAAVQGLEFGFSKDKMFSICNHLSLSYFVSLSQSPIPCYALTFCKCSHEALTF